MKYGCIFKTFFSIYLFSKNISKIFLSPGEKSEVCDKNNIKKNIKLNALYIHIKFTVADKQMSGFGLGLYG